MSDNPRLCAAASLIVGLFLAGCDGAKLCRQCERPPKAPETVQVEVDWQKLADALKDAGVGGTTVWTETVNMTVNPDPPSESSSTVEVAGWEDLVKTLESIQTAAASTDKVHHTTFAFRFAPPWFNADQRSLFTSYVVFPVEAQFDEWIAGEPGKWIAGKPNERCAQENAPASVCPDTAFYANAMGPFLEGLSRCATTKKVKLHLVGFASSTLLKEPPEGESKTELDRRYDDHMEMTAEPGSCLGESGPDEGDSDRFNLLIANERAVNGAEMLEELVPQKSKNAFAIKAIPWCSHAAMVEERKFEDGGDVAKGLMNRRAEVRLAALPGCLNVEPDKRIPVTKDPTKAAQTG